MRRWTTALLVFGALVAIWEWLVRAGVWSPVLVPSPVDVGKYLVTSIQDKTLLEASYVTLKRLLLG